MNTDLLSTLWNLIEPVLEPEGIELVELEFKADRGRAVLRLYIDKPGGVTLNDCELVSRQVGALLDIKDPIEQSYRLEVSSPGINRVLRRERDFIRFSGSPVRIKTRLKLDGSRNFRGVLKGVENSNVLLDVAGSLLEISLDDIDKARLDLPDSEIFRRDSLQEAAAAGD